MLKNLIFIGLFLFLFSCNSKTEVSQPAEKSALTVEKPQTGALVEVSPEKLLTILKYDKHAFIIDISKKNNPSRACKLIGNYRHITGSYITKNPDILPKNRTIVLLSKTGTEGRKLGMFLVRRGYTVYNLEKGMNGYWAWREKIIRDKLKIYNKKINVIELYADDFGC